MKGFAENQPTWWRWSSRSRSGCYISISRRSASGAANVCVMSRAVRPFIDKSWSTFVSDPRLNVFRRLLGLRQRHQIWSDASRFGYGGHLGPPFRPSASTQGFLLSTCPVTRAPLARWRTDTHEAIGVLLCLRQWAPIVRGSDVTCYVDNVGICEAISSGKGPEGPQRIAKAIRVLAAEEGIRLRMCWVPRRQNRLADGLSRHFKWDYYFTDKSMRWRMKLAHNAEGQQGIKRLVTRISESCARVDRVTGWAADHYPVSAAARQTLRASSEGGSRTMAEQPHARRKSDERRMHRLKVYRDTSDKLEELLNSSPDHRPIPIQARSAPARTLCSQ